MAYNYTDVVFSLKGLTPTDKLVLLHLAEHADKDTGECWPGFGRLADFTGLTRRTVIYSINRLAELEFITVTPPTGTRKTNTYVVRMDKLVAASVSSTTKKAKRKYTRKADVNPTPADVEHLYTHGVWKEGANKGEPCTWCGTCGRHISIGSARVTHIKETHPELWAKVIQAMASQRGKQIEFIGTESAPDVDAFGLCTKCGTPFLTCPCDELAETTTFDIEAEDDELG
jgi:Helix-turn-helix domain